MKTWEQEWAENQVHWGSRRFAPDWYDGPRWEKPHWVARLLDRFYDDSKLKIEAITKVERTNGRVTIKREFHTLRARLYYIDHCAREAAEQAKQNLEANAPQLAAAAAAFLMGFKLLPFLFVGAIAVDATNAGTGGYNSTASFSHTCSGANRALVVAQFGGGASYVRYNSVDLTSQKSQYQNGWGKYVEVWSLVAPATGANNVTIGYGGNTDFGVSCISFSGAHQTALVDGTGSQSTNSNIVYANVTTSYNNTYIVGQAFTGNNLSNTARSGTVIRSANQTGFINVSQYQQQVTAGAATVSWTWGSSEATAAVAMGVREAGANTVSKTKGLQYAVKTTPSATTKSLTYGISGVARSLANGLTHYYKCDESSGNAYDSIGGVALVAQSGATFAAGKINNGISLTRASGHYFNASAKLFDGNNFSFNAIVKPATTPSVGDVYQLWSQKRTGAIYVNTMAGYSNDSGTPYIWFYVHTDASHADSEPHSAGFDHIIQYNVTLPTNDFSHIAGGFNSSTNALYLYLNNVLVAGGSATFTGTDISAADTSFELGRCVYATGRLWNGIIDEFATWNRMITSTEVGYLYNGGNGLQFPFTTTELYLIRLADMDINSTSNATSYATGSRAPPVETNGMFLYSVVNSEASYANNPATPTMSGWGVTWTQIETKVNGNTKTRLTVFGAPSSGATTGALTVSFGAETQAGCVGVLSYVPVMNMTGGVAGAVVQKPTNSGSTDTTFTITLAAAAKVGNRAIAFFEHGINTGTTPRANWTEYADLYNADAGACEVQYRPDAFETTASATVGSASNWAGIALELNQYPLTSTPPAKTKSLKYTVKITPTAPTKSLQYEVRKTPSAPTKSLKYCVKQAPSASGAATKTLKYTVKVAAAAAITKTLKYCVRQSPSATAAPTKGLIYKIKTPPAAPTKSLKYCVKQSPSATPAPTKSLKYCVKKSPSATAAPTKALKYCVRQAPSASGAATKSDKYTVRITPAAKTKSDQYAVKITPAAKTKSLQYSVRPTIAITKALKYCVKITPAAKTKSLQYAVRPTTAITKALKYCIKIAPVTAKTKGAQYAIVTIPGAKTKGLQYAIKPTNALTKALAYTVRTTAAAKTKALTYRVAAPTGITKALKYTVLAAAAAITKALKYTITITGGTATKDLSYKVSAANLKQKSLTYAVTTPASAITKQLQYEILAVDVIDIQKSAQYAVTATRQKTKALAYTVRVPASALQKSLTYAVRPSVAITKGTQYAVLVTPTAKQKSTGYAVRTEHQITKGLAYEIKTASAITKGLSYAILQASAIQKDATYAVRTQPTKTKQLRYEVLAPAIITKAAEYRIVLTPAAKTKGTEYRVRGAHAKTKALAYIVVQRVAITKALRYTVVLEHETTKALAYRIRGTAKVTKGLKYAVRPPIAITKQLRYIVKAPHATTKALRYVIRVYPYKRKPTPYSKKPTPYSKKNNPYHGLVHN